VQPITAAENRSAGRVGARGSDHCERSASAGGIRAARQAGITPAAMPTETRIVTSRAIRTGSISGGDVKR